MSRNSARYASAMKKCGPLNEEETAPARATGERETRGWLYTRRSVTQARWATAPLPGGNPPNGVAARHSVPSRFSPKKTGNDRSLRAHWRENLCILVAIVSSRLTVRVIRSVLVVAILFLVSLIAGQSFAGIHSSVTFLHLRACRRSNMRQ